MKHYRPVPFTGMLIALCLTNLLVMATVQACTIHMIGDSTMANKSDPETNPEFGWGQVLQSFFDANQVTVCNYALNGRSSKSFFGEGHWDKVRAALEPGDYVLIQFGHNDQKDKSPDRYTNPYTGYRANLVRYIEESRAKGAYPVLFTSIVRRNFNEQGTLVDTHGAYPLIVRDVARELKVPFVDMQLKSEQLVLALGIENSKELYLWLEPGQSERFPDGRQDNTHFCQKGAMAMARLAVEGLRENNLWSLVRALKETED